MGKSRVNPEGRMGTVPTPHPEQRCRECRVCMFVCAGACVCVCVCVCVLLLVVVVKHKGPKTLKEGLALVTSQKTRAGRVLVEVWPISASGR